MKKVFKFIGSALIFIGLMFLLGTAGASDTGRIGFDETVKQILIGLGIMGVGMMTTYIIEKKENV